MGDFIYVNSSSFKTTDPHAQERLAGSNVFIRLLSIRAVNDGAIWEAYNRLFGSAYSNQSSLSGDVASWALFASAEGIEVLQDGPYVRFRRTALVVGLSVSAGIATVGVAAPLTSAWESWDGGNPYDNTIPLSGETENGSGQHQIVIQPDGDLAASGLLLNNIYLQAEDPTQLLIRLYDTANNLIAEGRPNRFGYFDPGFTNTKWVDVTFGSDGCPIDQLVGHPSQTRLYWPPPDAVFATVPANPSWQIGDPCHADPDDPNTGDPPVEPGSGDGSTIGEAILLTPGDDPILIDTTLYSAGMEEGEPSYLCSYGYKAIWFYVVYNSAHSLASSYVLHWSNQTGSDELNVEPFINAEGDGDFSNLVRQEYDHVCQYSSGACYNGIIPGEGTRFYFRVQCTGDEDSFLFWASVFGGE